MPKSVFVFASNLRGRHGKGAALVAARDWGAREGLGEGVCGNSYALPTKNSRLETLTLNEIERFVERFLRYSERNPEEKFLLTAIGCGLAGYTPLDIAPMFKGAKDQQNLFFPESFLGILGLDNTRMSFDNRNELAQQHAGARENLTGML